MKKTAIVLSVLALLGTAVSVSAAKKQTKKVVYQTTIHCAKCGNKVKENISFEKGVTGLNVDVAAKTVSVEFNPAKTDTAALAKALRKLGYDAKVIEYK